LQQQQIRRLSSLTGHGCSNVNGASLVKTADVDVTDKQTVFNLTNKCAHRQKRL